MESEPLLPRRKHDKCPSSFWGGKDGALGWTVATAIMLINFITIGLGRMSGILYVDFMREYRVNRRLASAPFSVQQSTRNLFGPLVGLLGHRFGIRSVTIVGGLMGAGSAAACAFAKDITWITVFWGGVYGTGIAFTSTLSQVILDDYFEVNLSSASGLSFSGGSVGAMVFSFVLQTTIDDYGLANSYLIMGAVILLVAPLAITLTSPPWPKDQNEGGSSRNKTNLASNQRLTRSLSTADIFSDEKGIVINKNLDKTQIPSVGGSRNEAGSRGYYDVKNNSDLKYTYGTFEKNTSDTNLSSNVNRLLSQPGTSSMKQNTFNNSVDSENENIAKFMASIEELYSDSKDRVSKSTSLGLTGDKFFIRNSNRKKSNSKNSTMFSEKDLPSTSKYQDIVDYNVSIDSNPSTSDDCTLGATGGVDPTTTSNKLLTTLDCSYEKNSPKKEIESLKRLDEKTSELSRNLSSSNDLSYKLLYLKTNLQYDFPDLTFPKKVENIVLNSSEIDSPNTFDEHQVDSKFSIVDDDLESLTNIKSYMSSTSDNEAEKTISSNIADDPVDKTDINSSNKNENSTVDNSILNDQRIVKSEENTKETQKSSSMEREKSLVDKSPPQSKSSWKERSLPSKWSSNDQWYSSSHTSSSSEDPPGDSCCSISHPIRMILKLYFNPAFLVICLCRAVHLLTFMGVLTVIVDFSMDRGLLESDGKYAVTAMSLGDLIGRLCTGWVTDCMFIGLEKFMLIAMLLIGFISISLPIIPPSTILLLVCVYSILQGSVFIRHPILVSKYTRREERTVGMGFMTLFSGLLGFVMPVYIGYFRDGIGSYNQVFYINGAICAGIGLLWIFEPCLKKFVR